MLEITSIELMWSIPFISLIWCSILFLFIFYFIFQVLCICSWFLISLLILLFILYELTSILFHLPSNSILILSILIPIDLACYSQKSLIQLKDILISLYHTPLFWECLQYQGFKRDILVTLGTCIMFSEGIQVNLVLDMEPWALRMPPIHRN
jgi:hypothetical protein